VSLSGFDVVVAVTDHHGILAAGQSPPSQSSRERQRLRFELCQVRAFYDLRPGCEIQRIEDEIRMDGGFSRGIP
jgi:hypothetical protein